MIHIIQCLCPSRHAILGTAYPSEDTPDDVALAVFQIAVEKMLAMKAIRPECGICGSREWHYETGRTKWKTLEEAQPHLLQLEQENIASRALIDQLKASKN
jgi:hypothetical protein